MIRPDANRWHSTNGATMTEFSPDVALSRRIYRLIFRVLFFEFLLSLIIIAGVGLSVRAGGWFNPSLTMVQSLATTNATRTSRDFQQLTDQIGSMEDLRVGFAAIVDQNNRPLAMTVKDDSLWSDWQAECAEIIDLNSMTTYWNHVASVYEAPMGETGAYRLVVGMPDMAMILTLALSATAMLVSMVVGVLLTIPYVRSTFQRWRDGFKRLHKAMCGFGNGSDPKPLDVGAPDEIGYLMAAFNSMAGQLASRRQALILANEELEHRVEMRTCELRNAMAQLDEMASTDVLTGLSNRRALFVQLEEIFECIPDKALDTHCIMFDLDGFKAVNDTLGHKMGDELLKIAATTLRAHCRQHDIAARLGGDELVLVLKLPNIDRAVEISNRIRMKFEEDVAMLLRDHDISVQPSMSCGVASRIESKAKTPEELLVCADRALYSAKRAGKRRTEIFGSMPPITSSEASAHH